MDKLIKRIKQIIVVMIIICMLIFVFIGFVKIARDRVVAYTKQKAINQAMKSISEIIDDKFINSLELNNIINDNNENKTFINTTEINKIIKLANNILSESINEANVEKLFIPIGVLVNETLYNESGLGFYVKSKPISSYTADISVEVNDYGINNSMISIYLIIKVNVEILFPLNEESEFIESKIPLTMVIVEGDVPEGIIYSN